MKQDSLSGAQASEWGRRCARALAPLLGASDPQGDSNEWELNGQRVVIKCAHAKTKSVGVTYLMLEHLDAIIGAFEVETGEYDIWSLPSDVYRAEMTGTRSTGPSAGKVGNVKRTVFQTRGAYLGRLAINTDA